MNTAKYGANLAEMPPADLAPGADNRERLWILRCLLEAFRCMPCAGGDRLGGEFLGQFIREDAQYDRVQEKTYLSPTNWAGDGIPNGAEIGRLMAINTIVRILRVTAVAKADQTRTGIHANDEATLPLERHYTRDRG